MSKREKTQADFDLERVMDLFDSALTSKDERVVNALRQLLMITALTAPESNDDMMDKRNGPFRQLQEELQDLYRRLNTIENEMNNMRRQPYVPPQPYNPGSGVGSPFGPYTNPGAGNPWGIDPTLPYTTNKASSSSSYTLTDNEKDSIINSLTVKLTK